MIDCQFPCRMIIHAYKEEETWRFELMKHEIWNTECLLEPLVGVTTRLTDFEWATECFGEAFDVRDPENWAPLGWEDKLDEYEHAMIEVIGIYYLEVDHCVNSWSYDPPEDQWYGYLRPDKSLFLTGIEAVDKACAFLNYP